MKGLILIANSATVDGVPSQIKFLPMGLVTSLEGDFNVDNESFESMDKIIKKRGLDIVIDYEHQTLKDVQAPAAGWVKAIHKTDEALVADVEWTDKAKEYLKNKEYQYISPVVLVRKEDRKALVLHSIALTNTPAVDGMFKVVNKMASGEVDLKEYDEDSKGGNEMELSVLIKLLGLKEDATEAEVKAAIEALQKKKDDEDAKVEIVANKTITGLLKLPENAKTEDVVTEIMSLKNSQKKESVDELVQLALSQGKITADQQDWAKEYAESDPKGFQVFVNKAVQVVPMDKVDTSDSKKKKDDGFDPVVMKNMDISAEDYEKYGKDE
jgi:phage I-like protein